MRLNGCRSALLTTLTVAAVSTASIVACTSSTKTAPEGSAVNSKEPAKASWATKMQSLSQTLSSLLPLVSSRSKFNAEKNAARIEEDTRNLKALAHSLNTGEKPNSDPAMRMMTGLFDQDISRALDALKSGNRDYARHILRDTTSYCIQCHTQTTNGPSFPHLSLNINTNELNSLEQAEFFAATRQFDKSLEAYIKALSGDELAKSDPFEWENAARTALAITVRVKNDPKQTMELVRNLEKNKSRPQSSGDAIKAWKKSIQEWSKEKQPAANTSESDQLKYAQNLITRAQKRQEFPLDHSQDILYFRASSLLHNLMQNRPTNDDVTARALYWSGVSSEATRDMNFWTLHETYYEQCIRMVPHSQQAMQCFTRLKDSVTLGYSGSSGTQIPPEVARRLETYRSLAQVSDATKPVQKQ